MNRTKQQNYINGKDGENIAKKFLEDKAWVTLEMNYRTDIGEIDLIMTDQKTLVFVEVKMKSDDFFGRPEEMVTKHKISQVRRVAEIYLLFNPKVKREYPQFRIDAVCILGNDIRHYQNIY